MASISRREFIVTPVDQQAATFGAARRVIVNAEVLKAAKIYAGDVLALSASGSDNAGEGPLKKQAFAVGVAWPSLEVSHDNVFVPSSILLTAHVSAGQRTRLYPLSSSVVGAATGTPTLSDVREAGAVSLRNVSRPRHSSGSRTQVSSEIHQSREWLKLLLRELLVELRHITHWQLLEVDFEGQTLRFAVSHISTSQSHDVTPVASVARGLTSLVLEDDRRIWSVGWDTVVRLEDKEDLPESSKTKTEAESIAPGSGAEAYQSVGGLDKQIAQIRDLLEIPLTRPELFRYFGLKPPRGILLYGPSGTGKTHLARAIASSTRSSVLVINGPELSSAYHGETESKLRAVFREAREKSPCIVVLDEVDALVPRREDSAGGEVEKRVVATLLTLLDGMGDDGGEDGASGRVVVIGTTNRPNAIDPALRRPGRFDREIEIGIPDATARLSILRVLLAKTPHAISNEDLQSLVSRAHGYVGADLSAVVREAGTIAIKEWVAAHPGSSAVSTSKPTLTLEHLLASLPTVRPSAMRSLFLETTPVRYADIGGQQHVIAKLREAVEWPLLHPESFARLGVSPPKGVLLCGPPGCSKTVLVRACACESGVNFVAIKGPELLNKFVGESERAVREIFRKARAASPSIIFFDEIDALATTRSSLETGAASHEGVLTTLLNEMDGVQDLGNVTVVAATNRPDVMDSALMRPGRLDRIIYVGPPDLQGRKEILTIRTRKMKVDPELDIAAIADMTEGCSGAEIYSLCQEAAILAMQKDFNAPFVPQDAFVAAARATKRQITPDVVKHFRRWREP